MIRILLAEDHQIVREGLRALLEADPDYEVIGEAGDGLEIIKLAAELKPDVIVMDVMMPNLNGLEATRQLCRKHPKLKVVILSMHKDEAYVAEALRNGACAYVLKDACSTDLVKAVREAMANRHYLSPPMTESSVEAYMEKASQSGTLDLYDTLTNREREVLQLCSEGHTNVEIGTKLFISHRTVETHRANLMSKLSLNSHTDLIRFALEKGILPLKRPSLNNG